MVIIKYTKEEMCLYFKTNYLTNYPGNGVYLVCRITVKYPTERFKRVNLYQ